MRPDYRSKRHHPASPEAQAVQSAVWLIGLGVLFLTGWWWPGILILVGLSMIAGALVRGSAPPAEAERLPEAPAAPPPATPPTPFTASAPEPVVLQARAVAPEPVRLPDLCPYCSAPPRTLPMRDPANPYACPYCGANLQSLKE
jgi:hypothetical protein